MPVYEYRAMTPGGMIVKNKVEEASEYTLLTKLKRNELIPIEITRKGNEKKFIKAHKKSTIDIDKLMSTAATVNLKKTTKELTTIDKINAALAQTEKITPRDVVIFTQNLYLLKKANFNNIHAISTIISSTENVTLKNILEEILDEIEGGRKYVFCYGKISIDISIYIY